MSYIDGFVIAVPTANKQKFIEHAGLVDTIFTDLGATRIVECWADDVPEGKITDFGKAVQATADESVVFSWIEWPDKETRDAAMTTMMSEDFKDERMDMEKNPMPFVTECLESTCDRVPESEQWNTATHLQSSDQRSSGAQAR
ncbi:MAG: DUF1428 domain-containing protein [Gammaproteobacteria bacterium]|nr:DUF1428 domain-containing protein [Gammaproteobacteria bacterium]MDH3552613.1 DUF1428 domain-containing protein [Gammaproteobacteria bacterium]